MNTFYRLGRLQKIEHEGVESAVAATNKSSKKSSKRQSSPNSDPPQSKRGGGGPTEAEQALIAEVLRLVEGLRQSTLANVPAKYRQEVVEENARTDSSTGDLRKEAKNPFRSGEVRLLLNGNGVDDSRSSKVHFRCVNEETCKVFLFGLAPNGPLNFWTIRKIELITLNLF